MTSSLKAELRSRLPHRYLFKHYSWSETFYNNVTHKVQFLKGCNQASKSSTCIRKAIEWATNTKLWPELWPTTIELGAKPNLFWYLYPDAKSTAAEVATKWMQFLPKFEWDEHPQYGWRFMPKSLTGGLTVIEFRTGIQIWFRYYSQDVQHLQSSSVFAIFCDEEIPPELTPELMARTNAVNGYFHMVWTPTTNHEHWRLTMEPKAEEVPISPYPQAWKRNFTLYDCVKYADGTQSPWTLERIKQTEAKYGTWEEVQRRVHGRCITMHSERTVPTFSSGKHIIPPFQLPRNWLIYAAIDHGKGVRLQKRGNVYHNAVKINGKASVVFLAVSPDYSHGVVFKSWRGDGVETEANDTLSKYVEMKADLNVTEACYDGAAYDLGTIAKRANIPLTTAKKDKGKGYQIMRSLFSAGMLHIFGQDDENGKLAVELENLLNIDSEQPDDMVDALRYVVMMIPWDFTKISDKPTDTYKNMEPEKRVVLDDRQARRLLTIGKMTAQEYRDNFREEAGPSAFSDLDEWGEMYDG